MARESFHACGPIVDALAITDSKPPITRFSMKTILVTLLLACALSGGACSRSENQDATVKATPNPNLKSDADRLQRTTAKAAEEREKESRLNQSPTPTQP
jgi:hypothetical protein